jgi:hypothetical protein
MKLSRLVPLLAVLAVVPACGNSPTAPLAEPGALLQSTGDTSTTLRTIPTTITTVTTTSTGGEPDSRDPKEGEGRGGGYVGSGN